MGDSGFGKMPVSKRSATLIFEWAEMIADEGGRQADDR